jgi:hypothetical protein
VTGPDTERIAALAEKATPGPWRVDDELFVVSLAAEIDDESGMETFDESIHIAAQGHTYRDAAFIAACDPQTVLALCADARLGARLREAAREVWASIPASYDYDDPMVQRHAKALNALGGLVEEYAPFARSAAEKLETGT